MSPVEGLAIFAGGIAAGGINTVVGSGTLITFPLLLALGYPPVTANASNTIGLVPGSLSGAVGYRAELQGQRSLITRLATVSIAGGFTGAVLLLVLPAEAFRAVVPAFIALALILIAVGPRLTKAMARRGVGAGRHRWVLPVGLFAAGIYGGYFGAAQGILLIAVLGIGLAEPLQRINGIKNVLTMFVNLVSGLVFVFAAPVAWGAAGLIAGGAVLGGQLGAHFGRRIPDTALRALVIAVGCIALVLLLL